MSNTENRGKVKGGGGRAAALRARLYPRRVLFAFALFPFALSLAACRQDMQDQPRYEAYEQSKFFADGQASRPYVEGTVARGYLRDDPAFYQGRRGANQQAGAGAQPQQQGAGGVATQNVLQTTSPNTQGANAGTTPGGEVNVRGNVAGNVPGGGGAGQTGTPGGVNEFPFAITATELDRGEERFQAYCLMCHGATGYGDGMIVRRGFRRPPSFHDDRLRSESLGHFFDVITNGWGAMASYSDMIPADDRWRIIAYIRALQLSQNAPGAAGAPAATTQPTQPPQGTNAQHASGGVNR